MTVAFLSDIKYDLSPKNGTLTGALISFFIALAVFVIAPYAVFLAVSGGMAAAWTGADAEILTDLLRDQVYRMMKYSIPLILLSLFVGFYRSGSYAKIPFRMIFALYLTSWLWIVSYGGVFEITISEMTVGIDIRYVVYVMMMICFAMMFLAFSEFGGNRMKYLKAAEKKRDIMNKRKARRLSV